MTEPENHTLALLREMRSDIAGLQGQLQATEERLNARFDRLERRVEAMQANGLKALKGFIGHRSMVERTMASFEVDLADVRRQLSVLQTETRPS